MDFLPTPYNPELMCMLDKFSEWFMEQEDLHKLPFHGNKDPTKYYVSEEYLAIMQAKDPKTDLSAEGFPSFTHGIDLSRDNHRLPPHMRKPCTDMHKKLNAWFGAKFCAVMMYYPPGGYMDWHNNSNCPGYNTLISYSHDGDGWFMFQDPITKAYHKMHDQPGWQVKVGYFGGHNEPEKKMWHCAATNTHRITFGYVIPDKFMWDMMCDDIKDVE